LEKGLEDVGNWKSWREKMKQGIEIFGREKNEWVEKIERENGRVWDLLFVNLEENTMWNFCFVMFFENKQKSMKNLMFRNDYEFFISGNISNFLHLERFRIFL
jgi:hypothetical protein